MAIRTNEPLPIMTEVNCSGPDRRTSGLDHTLLMARQSAAPIISRSPLHAPSVSGPSDRRASKAIATPTMATSTPTSLRPVNASAPHIALTIKVSSGAVASARAPRAAVVYIKDALKRMGNSPNQSRPSPATASQS